MSTKHTAEPWAADDMGHIVDDRRETICTMRHAYDIDGPANGARIVQCVNACQGISDPAAALQQAREALECIARGNTDPDDMVAIALSAVRALGGAP